MNKQKQGRSRCVHNRGRHHGADHRTHVSMAWKILVGTSKCEFTPIGKPYEVDSYLQLAGTAQHSLGLAIDDGSDRACSAIDNDIRIMGSFDVIENFEVDVVARPCVGRREALT